MKRARRRLSVLVAAAVTVSMIPSQSALAAKDRTYTDEEIEKRIDEVGEEYLSFYRDGYLEYEQEMAYENIAVEEDAVFDTADAVFETADAGAAMKARVQTSAPVYSASTPNMVTDSEENFLTVTDDGFYMGPDEDFNMEKYAPVDESGFISTKTQPFSTFGADVDTASYSSLRRRLLEPYSYSENPWFTGIDNSAIRLEEMINYFGYAYPEPEEGEKFGVTTALCKCPWNDDTLLFRVGVKAEDPVEESAGSNIVFLIDTSGSMFDFDKLPLVKRSLEILTEKLDKNDRVSIVTYAGSEEVALEGADGDEHDRILDAVNGLEAWGSTWGEGGIEKAYEIADKYFIEGGNNRIVLCTDGDFNVGVSSEAGLKDLISKKRDTGIFFSCLGFGGGNYNDTTMETLADNGNGNYFYIDCEREANRALNEEFFSTIYTTAKDTKFQVEFNPATVKGYRLIGYENRKMAAEDFADDTKDGGEVGAGQTVTVLYEVVPAGADFDIPEVASRYGNRETGDSAAAEAETAADSNDEPETGTDNSNESEAETGTDDETSDTDGELLVVNIRYKEPDGDTSTLREFPVRPEEIEDEMDADTSWAAGVAQAGMIMRDSAYAGTSTLDDVYARLKNDPEIMDNDYKAEFLFMLRAMKDYKSKETDVE